MTKLAMTTREVAESLSLGESTIRKMVAEGRFPQPFYIGESKIYRDAIALLNTQSTDCVGGYRIAAKLVENKGEIAAMLNEMTTEQKVIMKPILKQTQDAL